MVRALKFEYFRGFRELEVDPVKRINLFAGATNVGKTAILEGIYLLFAGLEQAAQLPSMFRSSVQGNARGLEKLRYLKAPGTGHALVYAYFVGKNAISINQTGQGFSKLLSLFGRMLLAKGRVQRVKGKLEVITHDKGMLDVAEKSGLEVR
jgi:AAA15 family ATPase/GTPase